MKFTVGKRLYLVFAILITLTGGMGWFSLSNMGLVNQQATELEEKWLPAVERLAEIRYLTEHLMATELKHVTSTEKSYMERYEEEMGWTIDALEKKVAEYEPTITSDQEKALYQQFRAEWEEYITLHNELTALSRSNDKEKARNMVRDSNQQFSETQAFLNTLVKMNHGFAAEAGAEAESIYAESKQYTLLTILVVVLVCGVFAFSLSRSIAKPLKSINSSVQQLAAGDLRIEPIVVKNKDEIGELAKSFNDMVLNLREIVGTVRKTAVELAASSNEMAASTEEVTVGVQEVAVNVGLVAEDSQRGNQAMIDSSKVMLELSSLIQIAKAKATTAADSSNDTLQVAYKGRETIHETVVSMGRIKEKSAEAKQWIQTLDEYSQQIGLITTTITNLANQTNLLALNAAIEAARAGEAGRGFAVVADEVRKLAEQSTAGASEVAALVDKIMASTSTVVGVTEQNMLEVEKGVSMVNQAGDALENILEAVSLTVTNINGIRDITDDEVASSERIVSLISLLARTIEDMASRAQEVAASTEEMSASMDTIAASTEQSSVVASELEARVDQFKL